MAFVSLKTWRARSAAQAALAARLKVEIAAVLRLGPADALNLNEIACPDPGCLDVETVVLVMRAGAPTLALKIARPMAEIGPEELESLRAQDQAQNPAKPG